MHLINDILFRLLGRSFVCVAVLRVKENIKYWGVKDGPLFNAVHHGGTA
jgi:hypothetical protein